MASYSSWQGTRMHINKTMLTDVFKGQLGFAGFVGSDYNGCYQNGVDTLARRCLNAGVDMFMTLRAARASSFLSMMTARWFRAPCRSARIDDAARRILVGQVRDGRCSTARSGLVDRSLTAQVGSAAHRAVARQAVASRWWC